MKNCLFTRIAVVVLQVPDITEEKLRQIFQSHGTISDVIVKRHSRMKNPPRQKGYGFVYFSTHDEAVAAVAAMNNQTVDEILLICSLSNRESESVADDQESILAPSSNGYQSMGRQERHRILGNGSSQSYHDHGSTATRAQTFTTVHGSGSNSYVSSYRQPHMNPGFPQTQVQGYFDPNQPFVQNPYAVRMTANMFPPPYPSAGHYPQVPPLPTWPYPHGIPYNVSIGSMLSVRTDTGSISHNITSPSVQSSVSTSTSRSSDATPTGMRSTFGSQHVHPTQTVAPYSADPAPILQHPQQAHPNAPLNTTDPNVPINGYSVGNNSHSFNGYATHLSHQGQSVYPLSNGGPAHPNHNYQGNNQHPQQFFPMPPPQPPHPHYHH
jgi:hypothetical protein